MACQLPFVPSRVCATISSKDIFLTPSPAIRHNTFASAGGDGIVSIWDHNAKKRLRQYPKYHNSVNDVAFNSTGTKLAIGVSYGWDKAAVGSALPENARVSVFVREIGDEVKVCTCYLCFYSKLLC